MYLRYLFSTNWCFKAGNLTLHVLAAAAKVFRKTSQKRYVYVKVQLLKMSTVYLLAPVGVLFVMISTVSSDVPLRSELAWSRPSKSSQRSHAAPFHSPSCSTLPSFPVWIPAPHSAPTFGLNRACPPIPSHSLSLPPKAPCPQSMHYFIHDFLILKTSL